MFAFKEKRSGKWLYGVNYKGAECAPDRFTVFATRESAILWFWGTDLNRNEFELVKVKLIEDEEAD